MTIIRNENRKTQTAERPVAPAQPGPTGAGSGETALAARAPESPLVRVQRILEGNREKIRAQVPASIDINAQIGATLAMLKARSNVLECSVASITAAVIECSQLELYLHPQLKHAYLVPFNSRIKRDGRWVDNFVATVIVGVPGLIKKAVEHGVIKKASVLRVFENDEFDWGVEYLGGEDRTWLSYKPCRDHAKRGGLIAVVPSVTLPDGTPFWRVMYRDRIEEIRDRSPAMQAYYRSEAGAKEKGWAPPKPTPWHTDPEEMADKTGLKFLFKLVPMSVKFAETLNKLEASDPFTIDLDDVSGAFTRQNGAPEGGPELGSRPELGLDENVGVEAESGAGEESAAGPPAGNAPTESKAADQRKRLDQI